MSKRIIQFGTSRFLQAHVDLFVHEARVAGQPIGPVTIVKTTSGADRSGRIPALKRGAPFPVHIRGVFAGRVVDDRIDVGCVDQAFDAETEWSSVVRCFARDAEIAVSNVGDRGYEVDAADNLEELDSRRAPPRSFPAKLLVLLRARFLEGGKPLLFLPTELVSRNGSRLSGIVSNLADLTGQSQAFQNWLRHSVVFADTLVDRIVSAPIEPVGAVAEPYALWAIRQGSFAAPFAHPAVQIVDDLEPFERLKLHILNLGHTVLVDQWLRQGAPSETVVRELVTEGAAAENLLAIYHEEVIPGFARRGLASEAEAYVHATLDRFRNPFLDHRLSDIAQNHRAKVANRIAAFIDWIQERDPEFSAPRLQAAMLA